MGKRLVVCDSRAEANMLNSASINKDDVFIVFRDRTMGERFSSIIYTTNAQLRLDRAKETLAWDEMLQCRVEQDSV